MSAIATLLPYVTTALAALAAWYYRAKSQSHKARADRAESQAKAASVAVEKVVSMSRVVAQNNDREIEQQASDANSDVFTRADY